MANEKPSTQTQPHGDAATRKKTETSVAEAGSSAEKKVTPKNALLGLQHVLVSNVWLDPVFVAGAIGLPLASSPAWSRLSRPRNWCACPSFRVLPRRSTR